MRSWILFLLLTVGLLASRSARAQAISLDCGGVCVAAVGASAGASVAGFVEHVAFTVDDIRMAVKHVRPRRTDGVHEVAFMIPSLVIESVLFAWFVSQTSGDGSWTGFAIGESVELAWTLSLMAHGIWAIARGDSPPDVPVITSRAPSVSVVPFVRAEPTGRTSGVALTARF